MSTTEIYHILYRSKAVPGLPKEELAKILASSRKNNPPRKVTGLLIYRQGYFLQLLEGPEEAVAERFGVIMRDTRHDDVEIMVRTKSSEHLLANWDMGYLDEEVNPSGVKIEVMNQLHDYAIKNARPANIETVQTILTSFRKGCRDLSAEKPA